MNGKIFAATIAAFVMASIVLIAQKTGLWVISAVPVGFLFGFFLHKGKLCVATAFAELLLFKNPRKIFGLWICIVVSMAGFVLLELTGLAKPEPMHLLWGNALVGGIIFGIGAVLAGGEIGACLYKSGAGNLSSMAALIAASLGISLASVGVLRPFNERLQALVIEGKGKDALTLSSVVGVSFWVFPLAFVCITGAILFYRRRKTILAAEASPGKKTLLMRFSRPWKPWQAGLAVGIVAVFASLSAASCGRSYPLGVARGLANLHSLTTESRPVYEWKASDAKTTQGGEFPLPDSEQPTIQWWALALVWGTIAGGWASSALFGRARLLSRPPRKLIAAFVGGMLLGIGAGIGQGGAVANIFSGTAMLSLGSMVFGLAFLLSVGVVSYCFWLGGIENPLLTKKSQAALPQTTAGKKTIFALLVILLLCAVASFIYLACRQEQSEAKIDFPTSGTIPKQKTVNGHNPGLPTKTVNEHKPDLPILDCMGSWYPALNSQTRHLQQLGTRTFRLENSGAGIKLDRILLVQSKQVKSYPREVGEIAYSLQKASLEKDLAAWIKWRRENSMTLSQKKQADFLEKFSDDKFELQIDSQLQELENAVDSLEDEIDDGSVSEKAARKVSQILDAINRKYQEQKQLFDSAVASFQSWK